MTERVFPQLVAGQSLVLQYKPDREELLCVQEQLIRLYKGTFDGYGVNYVYQTPNGNWVCRRGIYSKHRAGFDTVSWTNTLYKRLSEEFDFWYIRTIRPGTRRYECEFLFGASYVPRSYSKLLFKLHPELLQPDKRQKEIRILMDQSRRELGIGPEHCSEVLQYYLLRAYVPSMKWDRAAYERLIGYVFGKWMVPYAKELREIEWWKDCINWDKSRYVALVWTKTKDMFAFVFWSKILRRVRYASLKKYVVRKVCVGRHDQENVWGDTAEMLLRVYKNPRIKSRKKLLALLESKDNRPKRVHDTCALWINQYNSKCIVSRRKNEKPYNLSPDVRSWLPILEKELLACSGVTKVTWPEYRWQVAEWGIWGGHCISTYAKNHGKTVLLVEVEVAGQRTHLGISYRYDFDKGCVFPFISQWYGRGNTTFVELGQVQTELESRLGWIRLPVTRGVSAQEPVG